MLDNATLQVMGYLYLVSPIRLEMNKQWAAMPRVRLPFQLYIFSTVYHFSRKRKAE